MCGRRDCQLAELVRDLQVRVTGQTAAAPVHTQTAQTVGLTFRDVFDSLADYRTIC